MDTGRGRSTAARILAAVDAEPRDARELYHRVAADGRRTEGNVTVKIVRTVLARLVDLGQIVRTREGDDDEGAVLYRCVGD